MCKTEKFNFFFCACITRKVDIPALKNGFVYTYLCNIYDCFHNRHFGGFWIYFVTTCTLKSNTYPQSFWPYPEFHKFAFLQLFGYNAIIRIYEKKVVWMPVNITLEMVQQLMEQNSSLLKQNEELTNNVDHMGQTIKELNKTIDRLNQTIKELREQINQNSRNSSKPPHLMDWKSRL